MTTFHHIEFCTKLGFRFSEKIIHQIPWFFSENLAFVNKDLKPYFDRIALGVVHLLITPPHPAYVR